MMMNVAIAGASGRMGRTLIEAVLESDDLALSGALEVASSSALGRDAGDFIGQVTGVTVTDALEQGLAEAKVLIDFTRPQGSLLHLQACGIGRK